MSTKERKEGEERQSNRWRRHHTVLATLLLSEDDELADLAGELGHATVDDERLRLARNLAQTVLEGLLSGREEDWAPIEVAMAAAGAVRVGSKAKMTPVASGIRPAGRQAARSRRGAPDSPGKARPGLGPDDSAESSKTSHSRYLPSPHVGERTLGDAAESSRPHVGEPCKPDEEPTSEPPSTDPTPPPSGEPLPYPPAGPWSPPAELEPTPSSTITETTLPAVSPPSVVPLQPVPPSPATRPDRKPYPASPRPASPVPSPPVWPRRPRPSPVPAPIEPAPARPTPHGPSPTEPSTRPTPPRRGPVEPAPLSPTLPSYAPPTPHGTPAPRESPRVVPLRPAEPTPLPELVPLRPAAHLLDDTATEAAALPMTVERYAALTAMSEHAYHEQHERMLAAFGMSPEVDRRRLDAVYADTFRRRPSLRQRFGRALQQWRTMLASRRRRR